MRKKYKILLAISLIVVAIALIILRLKNDRNIDFKDKKEFQEIRQDIKDDASIADDIGQYDKVKKKDNGSDPIKRNIISAFKEEISYVSPIEFYGIVVDQYNDPVEEAKIFVVIDTYDQDLSVHIDRKELELSYKKIVLYSDNHGRFNITNEEGLNLYIKTLLSKIDFHRK